MIKKFDTYNESLRDKMKPKSEEEIIKAIKKQDEKIALVKCTEFDYVDEFKKMLPDMIVPITKKQLINLLKAAKFYNSKKIIKFLTDEKLDESLIDKMTPKSEDEIKDSEKDILYKISKIMIDTGEFTEKQALLKLTAAKYYIFDKHEDGWSDEEIAKRFID